MVAIPISRSIVIDSDEIEEIFTRSSGPGGQHVNTTDSAVMLRFDVARSPSLPNAVKHRLAAIAGSRMTREGVLLLRSEGARSQILNRQEVRERLVEMIREALIVPKKRRPTKASRAARAKRMESKARRGTIKQGRGKVRFD